MCSTVLRVLATLLSLNWALLIGVWLWTICGWYSRDTMSEKKAKLFFMARRTNWKRNAMYLAEKCIIFFFVSVLSRSLVFPFSLFSDYLRADVKYRGNIHWTSLLRQNIEIWREINLFFVFKMAKAIGNLWS